MTKHWIAKLIRTFRFPSLSRHTAWAVMLLTIPATLPAQTVTFTSFNVPTASSAPAHIVVGSDNNLWFTENSGNKIGRITTAGAFTEFPITTPQSFPIGIAAGSDGNLWFVESTTDKVGRITTAGVITEFPLRAGSVPIDITSGPDGNLWFTAPGGNYIGRITPAGAVTEFAIPTVGSAAYGITTGPDGNLWFVEVADDANKVGRLTPTGTFTEFTIPTAKAGARYIVTGPDGALWFTESNKFRIGRVTTTGTFTEFLAPPASAFPYGISVGPDNAVWFTAAASIASVTTGGTFTVFPVPTADPNASFPSIVKGPDGAMWFLEPGTNKIWRAALSAGLTVTSAHAGSFVQGQPTAFYKLTVTNAGTAASNGVISVTDTLPAGFTATAITGPGWTCNLATLTCTRGDSLPANATFPPITVTLSVAATAGNGNNVATVALAGAQQGTFTDATSVIPPFQDITGNETVYLPAIDLLQESGITKGCQSSPPGYCSAQAIPEEQMAVFVIRSVEGSDNFTYTPLPYFTDVGSDSVYFPFIQRMQDRSIAYLCGATTFCPSAVVTRAIMSQLIIRSRLGITGVPTNFPATPYFTDVPSTHPFFPYIQKMRQLGITSGCTATTYCPDDPVTRGQMAVFIERGEFNTLLPDGIPIIVWMSPSAITHGQSATVTIIGQNTNFGAGSTINAGAGITVSNISVVNSTTMTALLTVAANAALGPRSINVVTGGEEATLPNGLKIQ